MPDDVAVVDAPPAAPAAPPAVPPGAPPAAPPSAPPEWLAALPEELRGDKTLAKYADPAAAHKAHVELQRAYGAKVEGMVRLPPKDAKLDSPEVKAYREAAGVPLTVDGYKDVKIPETASGTMSQDGVKAWIENVALPRGMDVETAQANVNFLAEWNSRQMDTMKRGWIDAQKPLLDSWGANRARELGMAARAVDWMEKDAGMSGEFMQMVKGMGLNEHPDWLRLWSHLGRTLYEGRIVPGGIEGSQTSAEMVEKAAALRAELATPGKVSDKDRPAKLAQLEALLRGAHGSAEAVPR